MAEALQCRAVPGSLKQIDAGAGRVCGVDNADNLVSYQGNSWVSLAMKGKHVSVGPAGLWSVSLASLVFKWLRGRWIQVQPGEAAADLYGLEMMAFKFIHG